MSNSGQHNEPGHSNGVISGPFQLDDWIIDPDTGSITRENETIHLEPKVMTLLVTLASEQGRVHSRDELLDRVWAGTVVSDEALSNAIIKLRKALSDNAKNPRYIETLSKRGYRLIAPVVQQQSSAFVTETAIEPGFEKSGRSVAKKQLPGNRKIVTLLVIGVAVVLGVGYTFYEPAKVDETETTAITEVDRLPLPDKPSIAVLPFLNIGNEISDAYFSEGITDDLITDLAKISGLFIISRNSSFKYKGTGTDVREVSKALGVRYILEGSVRRSGNRVRVNTQLIDGLSGGQLWAERYEGDMKDVFTLQDRITTRIISALSLKLSPQDEDNLAQADTTNPDAYDEFLKGWKLRWRVNRETYAQAEQHFRNALEHDPDYARAHAGLALLYMQIWQQGWHQNSGTQHASWSRAREHLEAAMSNPDTLTHSLRSTFYLHNRRFDQAIAEARQAVAMNPSSAEGHLALAEAMSYAGEILTAIYHAEKGQRLDPNFPAPYLIVKGRALFDREVYPAALKTLEKARRVNPDNTNSLIYQVAAYGQLGETDYAKTVLDQLNARLKSDQLPPFTLSTLRNRLPYKYRETLQHLKDGLKKGGVPEW